MSRIALTLFLLTPLLTAQDDPRDAYKQAKGMRRKSEKKAYAADAAARFAATAQGNDHRYMGYLWRWAGEPGKSADSFGAYLAEVKDTKPQNRALAMLERAISLVDARRFGAVPSAAQEYYGEFPGHKYIGRIRFYEARAHRMEGRLDRALDAFQAGAVAGHGPSKYEKVDCLIQLGRYREAGAAAREQDDGSARYSTLMRAMPNLGLPLPKPAFDYWTGTELAWAEVKERPVVWSFWSTMAKYRLNQGIHEITNTWRRDYSGKVHCIGPAVYLKFDPVSMKYVDDMTQRDEQEFISDWYEQYKLEYPLVLMSDASLHERCGINPDKPALPAFALSDKKGVLRYVRVGGSDWEVEAVEAMMRQLIKE
ncbi:MAG: hypothetical protein ACYTEZ_11085 [Planctomycetota bacterium]